MKNPSQKVRGGRRRWCWWLGWAGLPSPANETQRWVSGVCRVQQPRIHFCFWRDVFCEPTLPHHPSFVQPSFHPTFPLSAFPSFCPSKESFIFCLHDISADLQARCVKLGGNPEEFQGEPPSVNMTSVNSPACLLARNHFYKNNSPTESTKPEFSLSEDPLPPRQRQLTVWVTMSTPPGFPGEITRGCWISIVLTSPFSQPSPIKHPRPANRAVK